MIIDSWEELKLYYQAIASLESACPGLSVWDRTGWEKLFKSLKIFASLEFRETALAGFCVVSKVEEESELLKIAVDPKCRLNGTGSRLLKQSIQMLSARGVDTIHLEVRSNNLAAIRLYEKFHFKAIGLRKGYYADPIGDAVIYSLNIKP